MPSKYIDFERVDKLSAFESDKLLYRKILKVSEESGELAQAFLGYDGASNASSSANPSREAILEEACDVINCAMSVISVMQFTDEETKTMFDKKLDKWQSKYE